MEALVKHFHLLCLDCCPCGESVLSFIQLCVEQSTLCPSQSTFCSSFTGSVLVQSKVRTPLERLKQLNFSFQRMAVLRSGCVQKCLHVTVSCNVTSMPSYVPCYWLKESNGRPIPGGVMMKYRSLICLLKL